MSEYRPASELDVEIHRKVFGKGATLTTVNTVNGAVAVWLEDNNPRGDGVPRYSTDIAAAWLVLEEMCRRIGDSLVAVVRHPRGEGWGCRFNGTAHPTSETAPLAICRAVLKFFREHPAETAGAS